MGYLRRVWIKKKHGTYGGMQQSQHMQLLWRMHAPPEKRKEKVKVKVATTPIFAS